MNVTQATGACAVLAGAWYVVTGSVTALGAFWIMAAIAGVAYGIQRGRRKVQSRA